MTSASPWVNKIVRYAEEAPEQLLANPKNFRVHPRNQQLALTGVLNDIGWIAPVVVNSVTQHVIDGHLRVELAISKGEPTVPVAYVELSESEEAEALATFDPLAAMAATDSAQLAELLDEVSTGDAAVQAMLDQLAQDAGVVPPDVEFKEYDESTADDVKYTECPECGHKWPA